MCKSETIWLIVASCLFVTVMLSTVGIMATPGEFGSVYGIIGAFTVLPALYRSRPRRIWAVVTTIIMFGFIIWDHQAGKDYRRYSISQKAQEGEFNREESRRSKE